MSSGKYLNYYQRLGICYLQGGRCWQGFGECKKCLQFFRMSRVCEFATKIVVFLRVTKIAKKGVFLALCVFANTWDHCF